MAENDYYQISLKAILRNIEGNVLILGGDPKGTFAGYFDLPGGRINTDEFSVPFQEILKREISEELRVENIIIAEMPVAIGRLKSKERRPDTQIPIHVLYIFFEAQLLSGEPVISSEHSSIRWVNLQKVKTSELFTSGIREGVEMYLKRLK